MNLINNAIKYTDTGKISFTLEKKSSSKKSKVELLATVQDSGSGIKKSDLEKIFNSFEQADKHLHHNTGGSGLGLPIAKNLVMLMGGTIKVDSVYGKGSTFIVSLPLVKGEAGKLNEELDINNFVYVKKSGDVHVLVVDDMPVNRLVLEGFLEKHNLVLDMAGSGREAIKKAKSFKYDLIFMDHMMSDIDGIEATKAIREMKDPYYKTVPIVAISANALPEYKKLFLRSGMNDFLSKPVNAKRINDILAKWLPKEKLEQGSRRQGGQRRKKPEERIKEGRRLGELNPDQKILERLSRVEGLNVQAGLTHSGDKVSSYLTVLKQFCENLDGGVQDMLAFLKKSDWKNFSIAVHAYKGLFAIIGYDTLFAWSKKFEYAAKVLSGEFNLKEIKMPASDMDFLPEGEDDAKNICLSEFEAYIVSVKVFRARLLKTVFSAIGKPEKNKIEKDELDTLLKNLETACKKCKAQDAKKIIGRLQRSTTDNKKLDTELEKIASLVNNFDYEDALHHLTNYSALR